jgi:predicted  nucleic acid-binding Zn-ribbon protein
MPRRRDRGAEYRQEIRTLANRIHEMTVEMDAMRQREHALRAELADTKKRVLPDRISLTDVETRAVEMVQSVTAWALASSKRVAP